MTSNQLRKKVVCGGFVCNCVCVVCAHMCVLCAWESACVGVRVCMHSVCTQMCVYVFEYACVSVCVHARV